MLDLRGGHVQSGQFPEHFAAAGEADFGGHAADHALEPRGDRATVQAQGGVAGVAALAARAAMVVGAFQRERPQGGAEGLGAVPVEARLLAASAPPGGSLQIAAVGIEALREEAPHQFQGEAAGRQLDGFEVQVLAQVRTEQAVEFGGGRGGELRRAGFFLPSSAASRRAAWARAWQTCSLTSISSATNSRRRWHSAI